MDVNNDSIEDKEKEENLNGIPVSKDEPIYAISDFEGRYDYYIRFLMDIGFLDKEKLKNIVMKNCNTEEEQEICNAFFDGNPEEFLIDVYTKCHDIEKSKKLIQQNKTRLKWLIEHCMDMEEKILQARNENFKGKIVVNGDLYSDRIKFLLMNSIEYDQNLPDEKRTISCEEVKQLITDVNDRCLDLIFKLENQLNIKGKNKKIFLIAGNHDLYESDFFTEEKNEDCLQKVKNLSLIHTQLLKFVKFKIGDKTIVFKHSPYLSQDALNKIKRKKDREIQDESIRKYPNEPLKTKHLYYWKYASIKNKKYAVDEETIFCNNDVDNKKINQQLQENNYYMVFGHCGITTSNLSTYSIIDKN
ncbi:MAG: metallophosphoesterase [Rickettsiales bacterium]|nr:metallophosphoesterase [Rickettsiales bacterium]